MAFNLTRNMYCNEKKKLHYVKTGAKRYCANEPQPLSIFLTIWATFMKKEP